MYLQNFWPWGLRCHLFNIVFFIRINSFHLLLLFSFPNTFPAIVIGNFITKILLSGSMYIIWRSLSEILRSRRDQLQILLLQLNGQRAVDAVHRMNNFFYKCHSMLPIDNVHRYISKSTYTRRQWSYTIILFTLGKIFVYINPMNFFTCYPSFSLASCW